MNKAAPLFLLTLALATAAGCHTTEVNGPGGESVAATTPRSLTLHRGSSIALEVDIDREQFTGPVTVSVSQLPKGVSADRASAKVESTMATFVLEASKTADLVSNQKIAVTVEGMGGRKAMQYISLDVTD